MSHFNKGNPSLYVGSIALVFPEPDRGGRFEDFQKVVDRFENTNNKIVEDILGYRLTARYSWGHLSTVAFNGFVDAYNQAEGLRLKFSGWPKSYAVVIINFRKGLRDGLKYEDSLEIEFQGVDLMAKYPDLDLLYTVWGNHTQALCVLGKDLLDSSHDFNSGNWSSARPGITIIDADSFSNTTPGSGIYTTNQPLTIGDIYRLVWEGTSAVSISMLDISGGPHHEIPIGAGEDNFEFTAERADLLIESDIAQTVTKVAFILIKIGEA